MQIFFTGTPLVQSDFDWVSGHYSYLVLGSSLLYQRGVCGTNRLKFYGVLKLNVQHYSFKVCKSFLRIEKNT